MGISDLFSIKKYYTLLIKIYLQEKLLETFWSEIPNSVWNLKCPYYGLWKVHILVLGVPNNSLTCIQAQKTLSYSYNMHLFLPYLLNDSQTIRSTINFSKPLLCVTLICGDWSISFKAVFVSF